jgi:hypothetical protein
MAIREHLSAGVFGGMDETDRARVLRHNGRPATTGTSPYVAALGTRKGRHRRVIAMRLSAETAQRRTQ